jgi:signal transduction histidine kinase
VARIGFDLHDGPVQTLAALIADARLLESQLTPMLGHEHPALAGRLDDLKARMVALEFELRSMCQSLESPVVLQRPLERVVEQEIVSFKRATGAQLSAQVEGRFDELTPSQRIALLRIVQEALRNVQEHSGARNVALRIVAHDDHTEAEIADDGDGFDVEAALARAVADGRVGLLGMIERIRMLGGTAEVLSWPGGGTTVSVLLPRWRG